MSIINILWYPSPNKVALRRIALGDSGVMPSPTCNAHANACWIIFHLNYTGESDDTMVL